MITNEETDKQEVKENPFRSEANRLADKKSSNKTKNIVINGHDTYIPNNVPVALIGDKGSGKTTLIKSLMKLTYENKVFQHIFFIYSSITWDEELPPYVIRVDVNDADEFLGILFETKAIYNSYYKFFKSLDFKKLEALADKGDLKEEDFTQYVDNNIIKYNKDIFNSKMDANHKLDKVISVGEKILKTFSKQFRIGNVTIDGLKANDMDAVIIDDIAIAAKILFRQIKDNPIYEYFTLTRHMKLFILLAGQQIEQIPKSLRREMMCWIVSKNTNLELLDGVLSKATRIRIEQEQDRLKQYEFVVFNTIDGSINIC